MNLKAPTLLRQNNGQAALEAVIASLGLIGFAALLLFLIYFCTLKTYLQFSSHELLVCQEISEPWLCEKKFKQELQTFLRFGQIESLWTRQNAHQKVLQLRLSFTLLERKMVWSYKDEIQLPLRAD